MHVNWRRRFAVGVMAALIMAGLIYGFWPQRVLVDAVRVQQAPLQVSVTDEGKTRVIDRFMISAPVAGLAERINLKIGDPVQRGERMLEIEPMHPTVLDPRQRAQAEARVSAAKATLRAAESRADAAKTEANLAARDAARITKLCKVECASRQQQDQAVAQAQSARANQRSAEFAVKIAHYDLQAARTMLTYTHGHQSKKSAGLVPVNAPVKGTVLRVMHRSEGAVTPGTPLLELGNPQALEVTTDVLSEDAVRIHVGTRVIYKRWGGTATLQGLVTAVEPVAFTKVSALGIEEQRVRVISDITSPRELWKQLGDRYRMDVDFILWSGEKVRQVPSNALFRVGDRWAVFVIKKGRARRRFVELGHRSGLSAQVIKGLKVGDLVIAHPDSSIEEGTRVRLP